MPPPSTLIPVYGLVATFAGLTALLASLIVSSIPLWMASKLMGLRRSGFGNALLAVIVMPVLFTLAFFATMIFSPLNVVAGFLAALWGVKKIYDTGWLQALLLLMVSAIITLTLTFILAALLKTILMIP